MFGSPDRVFSASTDELATVPGVGPKTAACLSDPVGRRSARERAGRLLEELAEGETGILCPDDVFYPRRLLEIADPPPVLFYRGDPTCLDRPAVALVGSRAATSYGKRVSFELARGLARHNIGVVSGLAAGIDGEAHAGALAGGGWTAGVLGCGPDIIYPPGNSGLYEKVAGQGVILSEYPPGTPPDGFRFPERNRIISGMTLGTIVAEATLKSGSLITASLALDQGREVFAVPGRIDSPKSRGANRLIQMGARLVTCVEDVLEELDLAGILSHDADDPPAGEKVELSEEEARLLACLGETALTIDELQQRSGCDGGTISRLLLQLELKGLVNRLPGQQYERKPDIPAGLSNSRTARKLE
ncbi:MAG: DNA-processing protein DprA [Desulfobulbaceae bacterium]